LALRRARFGNRAAELDVAAECRCQAVERVVAVGVRLGRAEGMGFGKVDELHAAGLLRLEDPAVWFAGA
jgi:hypothetical protein